ncbi:MAG: PAS domain S-box protein [Deltaproteobacteria bacterium]
MTVREGPVPGGALDGLVGLLTQRLGTAIGCVSLVHGERLRFVARHGLDLDEAPHGATPCGHVVAQAAPLFVSDLLDDDRFAALPFVTTAPRARFYAGCPLLDSGGRVLGTLCLMDPRPRDLSAGDRELLTALSRVAAQNLELRAAALTYEDEAKRGIEDARTAALHLDDLGQVRWLSREARRLLELPDDRRLPTALDDLIAGSPSSMQTVLASVRDGLPVKGVEVRPALAAASASTRALRLDVDARSRPDRQPQVRCTLTDLSAPVEPTVLLRRYETLFDFVDLVCTADGRGHFDLMNPAWEALLGWSRRELQAHPFVWFVHPDDVAATHAVTRTLREDGRLTRFENRYRCRDGSYRTLSWTASVVDGVFVAAARDVTQDVAARERLRFTNGLYALIDTLQRQFIEHGEASSAWWQSALSGLISLTGSEYGFIGTVERDEHGKYLHTKAITDISWDEPTRQLYETHRSSGMIFRNLDTLFGRVIVEGATVVANDVAHDPRASGRPSGHPPLERFLGVACGRGDGLVGVIGLANRRDGYPPELVADLEPAAVFVETTVTSLRSTASRRVAETRLQAIVEASVDAIVSINERGVILTVNSAIERLFGYAPTECIGNNVSMLMPNPDHDAHDRYLAHYLATGEKRIIGKRRELVGRRKDGSEIWLELTVTEVQLEGARTFIGILKDVTARVLDDRRLRATATQLAGALEMANAARLEYDPSTDRFTLDDAFYKLLGTHVGSVGAYEVSSADYISRFVHPDDAGLVAVELARVGSVPDDTADPVRLEHRFLTDEGREGFLFVRLFGTRDRNQPSRKHYGVAQDVTVHRREEQVRARMAEQDRLNQALADRVQELDQSRRVSALTSECVELMQRCVSVEESLELTTRFLGQMYPDANIEVYEQLDATQELTLRTWEHRFGEHRPRETLETNDCWALRTRRVYAMLPGGSRIGCPHLTPELRDGEGACVCAPLLSMDRMVGLVSLALPPRSLGAAGRDERVARAVAQFETTMQSLGGALSTVSRRESLPRLALVDELTGLPNRRAFVAAAQKSIARAKRGRERVVVALFDIDHFKQVNDTWGHDGGDRVLRQIAEISLAFFRAEDVLGRLGGEEFGLLLSMGDVAQAEARLDAFRRQIRDRCRAGHKPVTVSIGFMVAEPGDAVSLDECMRIADAALYEAKGAGRDRVVLGKPPPLAPSVRPTTR